MAKRRQCRSGSRSVQSAPAVRAWVGRLARFDNRDKAQSAELRVSSAGPGPWQWTVGTFYRHADFNSVTTLFMMGAVDSTTGTPIDIVNAAPIESDSWSFYGNTSYDLTERLQIGAGLRYFTDKETAPLVSQANRRFDSLDPRFHVSYRLGQGWNVYTTIAKGFRSGGFNAINPEFPDAYEPEKVWSYELGTKFDAMQGLFSGEFAGFISRYSDMQSTVIATSIGLGYTGNIGRANIKGFDWALRLRPASWLVVGTSGTVMDTEVVRVLPSSAYIQGDRLNYIPKSTLSHFVEAQAQLRNGMKGWIRIDYNRRGRAMFAQRTANLTAAGDVLKLLNARVGVDTGRYGVEIYGDNLLNERGNIFPNPVSFGTRSVPRALGIKGTVSF